MKLLMENWRGYLKEIGDASSQSFPFKMRQIDEVGEYAIYEFHSPENKYTVHFMLDDRMKKPGAWEISFRNPQSATSVGLSGEGIPLKVMSTVVAIVKDFINREESKKSNEYMFTGLRKMGGGDQAGERSQRTKLYLAFLKRNMPPGTKIETIGQNEIHFTLPSDEQEMPQAAE